MFTKIHYLALSLAITVEFIVSQAASPTQSFGQTTHSSHGDGKKRKEKKRT
jgi:hypothetical protein